MTSLVVIAACILNIAGLLGGLRSGTTPEWADLFKWNDTSFVNTYTTIDSKHIGKKVGEITGTISRSVDTSTYIPANGEATYLQKGTDIYAIDGFDPGVYLAVDDNGDFFLYCPRDAVTDEVIKKCGAESYRSPVDFVYVSIPTVSEKVDDPIVRIRILDSIGDFEDYLDRYSDDFRKDDGSYTYQQAIDDRGYDEDFFDEKKIIAIYVPEESGEVVYSVSSLMSDATDMTLILKKSFLPTGIKYDTSDTRHMFLEIDADEYSNQKLAYQIEPTVIPNAEIDSGVNTLDAMKATVKIAGSLDDLLGTRYEPLVKGIYTREFFDRNMLIIVECSDRHGMSEYTLKDLVNEEGFIKINIDRKTDENAVTDPRMQYILVPYAKAEYHDEIIIPVAPEIDPTETDLPETDISTDVPPATEEPPATDDVPATDEPIATDGPGDEPQEDPSDDKPSAPIRPPVDYLPRDLLVVDNVDTIAELSDIYGVQEDLYDEAFFNNYILLFVGDTVASESVAYRYNECVKTEDGIVITVDKIVPEKCVALPANKYIAIPYLKSEYNGEPLSAKLNTIYEWEISENDNDGQS